MEIDEFIDQIAGEPERTITRDVWTTPPEMLAKARTSTGIKMTDLISARGRRAEPQEIRYRHILGSPASEQALEEWHRQHPLHVLPADLRALIAHVNGIHLWANVDTGRSYTGLAPIEEWDLARVKMYGASADRNLLADRYVALSYHQDGGSFIVLDVDSARYFLMDAAGPDTRSPIGNSASELLDWLWRTRITPKP